MLPVRYEMRRQLAELAALAALKRNSRLSPNLRNEALECSSSTSFRVLNFALVSIKHGANTFFIVDKVKSLGETSCFPGSQNA